MKYRPLGLDLIVKRRKIDLKKGNLFLPGKDKDNQVYVCEVGPGTTDEDVGVQPGETIIMQERSGYVLESGTDAEGQFYEYLLINKNNIICAVDVD